MENDFFQYSGAFECPLAKDRTFGSFSQLDEDAQNFRSNAIKRCDMCPLFLSTLDTIFEKCTIVHTMFAHLTFYVLCHALCNTYFMSESILKISQIYKKKLYKKKTFRILYVVMDINIRNKYGLGNFIGNVKI